MHRGSQCGCTARLPQGLQARQHDLTSEEMILSDPAMDLTLGSVEHRRPLGTGNGFRFASQVAPDRVARNAQFSGNGMERLSLRCSFMYGMNGSTPYQWSPPVVCDTHKRTTCSGVGQLCLAILGQVDIGINTV